jgi:hypothetical protein
MSQIPHFLRQYIATSTTALAVAMTNDASPVAKSNLPIEDLVESMWLKIVAGMGPHLVSMSDADVGAAKALFLETATKKLVAAGYRSAAAKAALYSTHAPVTEESKRAFDSLMAKIKQPPSPTKDTP